MRQRARNDEDKESRRQAILAAGLELWHESTWGQLTMSAVAERAGIVKGTVYLYFATKEELFAAILGDLMAEFFDDLDERLSNGRGTWTRRRVVDSVCAALEGRGSFTRILTILGSILEHNLSFDSALAFKRLTLDRFTRTGALLEKRLPFLAPGEGMRVVHQMSALLTGFANMAYPAPVLEEVFALPGLSVLRVDLVPEFHAAVTALLDGLEARGGSSPSRR